MLGTRRLQKEAKALKKAWGKDLIRVCGGPFPRSSPRCHVHWHPHFAQAAPNPKDLFEFHFVVDGPPDTPYEGGHYHGMLRFPAEYPMKVREHLAEACRSPLQCVVRVPAALSPRFRYSLQQCSCSRHLDASKQTSACASALVTTTLVRRAWR